MPSPEGGPGPRAPRANRDPPDPRGNGGLPGLKDPKDLPGPRGNKDLPGLRGNKDPKAPRVSRDPLDHRANKGLRAPLGPKDPKASRGNRDLPGPPGRMSMRPLWPLCSSSPMGRPSPLLTAVTDPTGHITQPSVTQVTLAPGTYFITYHVSAVLEAAGYLQITPAYSGQDLSGVRRL